MTIDWLFAQEQFFQSKFQIKSACDLSIQSRNDLPNLHQRSFTGGDLKL
jgi:hypothetical protein